jgi:hypothetical protein
MMGWFGNVSKSFRGVDAVLLNTGLWSSSALSNMAQEHGATDFQKLSALHCTNLPPENYLEYYIALLAIPEFF